MTRHRAPEQCANCGADIPPNAHACPECGADERTGWAEQNIYDGLDLPDDEETEEQNNRSRQKRKSIALFWWLVALAVIIAFALTALDLRRH